MATAATKLNEIVNNNNNNNTNSENDIAVTPELALNTEKAKEAIEELNNEKVIISIDGETKEAKEKIKALNEESVTIAVKADTS